MVGSVFPKKGLGLIIKDNLVDKVKNIIISVINGKIQVSAIYQEAPEAKAILTLAHGAGAGMQHDFMEKLTDELIRRQLSVFRFQFPYMEQGKKRPDNQKLAVQTVASVVEAVEGLGLKVPVFLSGKSYGGRMSSHWMRENQDRDVKGIVFYGFPLHPPGKPKIEKGSHLIDLAKPMLFLQGTRDHLAQLESVKELTAQLNNSAKLHIVEGGDHSFKVLKRSGRTQEEVMDELAEQTSMWVDHVQSL